jgi:NAD(P)-dependent dehydrogenase (short-subunit alcohol dehydrogenase family)
MAIFSKHLANEIAGHGVRINCVTLAEVLTERMEGRMPEGAERRAASVLLGRMGHRRPCRLRRSTTGRVGKTML